MICKKPTIQEHISIYGISNKNKEIHRNRGRMGAIIENPSICLNMTAEDNLKKQCKIVGIPDDKSLYEILKIVKLDNTKKIKKQNNLFFRNETAFRNCNCISRKTRLYSFF